MWFIPYKHVLVLLLLLAGSAAVHSQTIKTHLELEAAKQFASGHYAEALKARIELLKLAEKENNCRAIAFAHYEVGKMQYFVMDVKGALKTNIVAKRFIDSCNVDTLKAIICNNIGAMYHTLNRIDSALFYYNKSLQLLQKTKRYSDLSRIHSLLGKLYLTRDSVPNFIESKAHFDEALKTANISGNYTLQFFANIQLSDYYEEKGNLPLAIQFGQTAYDLVKKNKGKVEEQIFAAHILAHRLAKAENPRIQQLYDEFLSLKDSVFRTETAEKIADYKVLYETEKKVSENNLLQQENKLKQVTINNRNVTILSLVVSLVLITLLIVWRLHVSKLKKQFAELENEKKLQKDRERISRDLHDNVGGQLSYVLFSLEGNEEPSLEKRKEKSVHLAKALREVTGNLRETIWALNNDQLNLQEISDKLKLYSNTMFAYSNTKVKFDESIHNTVPLNPAVALHIFRICQEIINNVFKHAQATELTVSIEDKEQIKIIIADNGIGFSVDEQENTGFGLQNLKVRTEEIGATLHFSSSKQTGTSVTLLV